MIPNSRPRLYLALGAVALIGAACFFDEAPTGVGAADGMAALSILPSAPLAVSGSSDPINRIRVAATEVPDNVSISENTFDVDPDAAVWAVSLTVPASSEGTTVVVTIELINVAGDGTETVLYSGRSDVVLLFPGFSGTVEVPIEGLTGLVGNVYIAATGGILPEATVEIQDAATGAVVASVTTDAEGGYQVTDMDPGNYRIIASAPGYAPALGFATVVDGLTTTVSPIGSISETGPGDLSGTVQNAINTSELIVEAVVELRAGAGAPDSEPVVASTTTDGLGVFTFAGVQAGNYTIRTVAPEFADGHANVVVLANSLTSRLVLMSPALLAGEIRTVLTWGPALAEVAEDLDSHLTGPHNGLAAVNTTYHVDDVDGGRFHIAFYDNGSLDDVPGALLHNDDIDWEGPETTTIGQVLQGTYRFTVDLYCCTASIRSSQAKVEVFGSQGLVAQFNAPNQDGQTWIVFDLVDGQIVPINRVVQGRNEDTAQHLLAHPSVGVPVGPSAAPASSAREAHPKGPGK